jgi:hypothetical protein
VLRVWQGYVAAAIAARPYMNSSCFLFCRCSYANIFIVCFLHSVLAFFSLFGCTVVGALTCVDTNSSPVVDGMFKLAAVSAKEGGPAARLLQSLSVCPPSGKSSREHCIVHGLRGLPGYPGWPTSRRLLGPLWKLVMHNCEATATTDPSVSQSRHMSTWICYRTAPWP